jgi:hypothetical protein
VASLYLVIIATQFRNVLQDCKQTSVGFFGDAYGTMFANKIMSEYNFPIGRSSQNWTGFPAGEPLWTSDWWSSSVIRILSWLSTLVLGPICAYNFVAMAGIFLSSIAMWLLVLKLTKNSLISFIAGLTFGFSPFIQAKLTGHLNYTFIGVLPFSILLGLLLVESKKKRQFMGVGFGFGFLSYFDGYLTVCVWLVFCVSFIFRFVISRQSKNFTFLWIFPTFISSLVPLILGSLISKNIIGARNPGDLTTYSVHWWQLLLPQRSHSYFGKFLGNFQDSRLAGSNYSEATLYCASTFVIVGFIYGCCLFYQTVISPRWKNGKKSTKDVQSVLLLTFVVISSYLLALRPYIYIQDFGIPMPSGLLYSIYPAWRVLSRFAMLTNAALIALGAMGLNHFIQFKVRGLLMKAAFLVVFTMLTLFSIDFSKSLTPPISNVTQLPMVYHWLSQNTKPTDVVLDITPFSIDGFVVDFALIHNRKLANAWRFPDGSFGQSMPSPTSKEFQGLIDRNSIDYLVLHPKFYGIEEVVNFRGYKLVASFPLDEQQPYADWAYAKVFRRVM